MPQSQPTLEDPQNGVVFVVVNGRNIEITAAEYWVEADRHTIRSREFDCFASGDSKDDALSGFGRNVIAHAATLQARVDGNEATEAEAEAYERLAERLSRVYIAEQREPRRRGRLLRRGARHEHHRWGAVPA